MPIFSALASATGIGQRRCLHCMAPFQPAGNGLESLLCKTCLPDFLPYTGPACQFCGLPGQWTVCPDCARQKPVWAGLAWHGLYSGSLRDCLLRLKFDGELALSRLLGRMLAMASATLPRPDVILAVPQHPGHLRQRGFNQAHELAKELVRQLPQGLPNMRSLITAPGRKENEQSRTNNQVAGQECWLSAKKAGQDLSENNQLPRHLLRHDLLLRIRQQDTQARLDRVARQANVSQSFMVRPESRQELAGKVVWLVDDIMTTGSTLAAASEALLQAGAGSVWLLFVARTPRPEEYGPQNKK